MNDTIFLQAPKDVFYCEGVITENGECVPLTVFDKLVYFHMLDRKRLFVDRGGKHFEGQDTIAEVVQINRKTAIASLKKLMEVGLITGHKETHPSRGYSHWVYTDVNTSPKVYGDKRKNVTMFLVFVIIMTIHRLFFQVCKLIQINNYFTQLYSPIHKQ